MIKAIFFDVDGTLITADKSYLNDDVIKALNVLRDKGIKLFIASGRHYLELEELGINEQFIFDGYLLLNGGYCTIGNDVIYECKIDYDDMLAMYDVISTKNYPSLFIEDKQMYINRIDDRVIKAQEAINTSIPEVKEIVNLSQIYQLDPYVSKEELQDIIKDTKNIKVTKWHDFAYDIVPINGGKASAIKAIKDYYYFNKDELMAFGDGNNDIEMMELVGYPIVMDNGKDEVKKYARYICDSVDGLGIIDGLRYYGLLGDEDV